MLFNSWESIGRTVFVGVLAYVALVFFLRISGKRTLSKMNAFDLVVTVALGSTLATVLLNKDVALAEGATAFAVLIGLQFVITWLAVRSGWFRRMIKSHPTALVEDGRYIDAQLVDQRVSREEIEAALREHGLARVEHAEMVTLETDGTLTVVKKAGG